MTTTAVTRIAGPFDGDGADLTFDFSFYVRDTDELAVYKVNETTGVETIQTYGAHYSIGGVAPFNGGTVTFVTAPTSTEKVVLVGIEAYDNEETLQQQAISASAINRNFDHLTRCIQQLRDELNRCLKFGQVTAYRANNPKLDDPSAGSVGKYIKLSDDTPPTYIHDTPA